MGAAAMGLAGCRTTSPALSRAARRPNVVLIMSDDMGFSDLGCYGGEINTPNLDGLAAEGVRFTQFYNAARCCPTRASLMTGLYPHRAGVGHMTADNGFGSYRGELSNRCVTIAEVLKRAGYGTYMAGKWHVARDELQPKIWPPMKARDGRPVRGGPTVMPGPADTYIAYGQNWANVSNTPFREYKHWVHEGGISTPLICHWPAGIKARGGLCHDPGHLMDIMSTCVDVAGAEYPAERQGQKVVPMEGRSLRPAFGGQALGERAIFWEHEGNRAVRKGRWKLVSKHPGGWEFHDIAADRTEMHDLASEHPETVRELQTLYENWAARCGV